jgi:acyl-CoA synthetase (AMP-forming)/AMP-acid ligase II
MKPGHAFDPRSLREHCRRLLARVKVPKTYVQRDALRRNPSGKLLERVLRDEYAGGTRPAAPAP